MFNIRQMIREKKAEHTKLKEIYNVELKKQKEEFAKEKAEIKVDSMREKARTVAREGHVKPFLKRVGKELKQHKQRAKHRGMGLGSGGGGPQFGLTNKNAFDIKVKK